MYSFTLLKFVPNTALYSRKKAGSLSFRYYYVHCTLNSYLIWGRWRFIFVVPPTNYKLVLEIRRKIRSFLQLFISFCRYKQTTFCAFFHISFRSFHCKHILEWTVRYNETINKKYDLIDQSWLINVVIFIHNNEHSYILN